MTLQICADVGVSGPEENCTQSFDRDLVHYDCEVGFCVSVFSFELLFLLSMVAPYTVIHYLRKTPWLRLEYSRNADIVCGFHLTRTFGRTPET